MRDIKFRGMSLNDGWVYGNFIHSKRFHGCSNEFRIHNQETGLESDIIADTLGEFSGLHDKNGIEIYEGDILHYRQVDVFEEIGYYDIYVKVIFQDCAFGWIGETTGRFISFSEQNLSDHGVAGNIHQNIELLTQNP